MGYPSVKDESSLLFLKDKGVCAVYSDEEKRNI